MSDATGWVSGTRYEIYTDEGAWGGADDEATAIKHAEALVDHGHDAVSVYDVEADEDVWTQ